MAALDDGYEVDLRHLVTYDNRPLDPSLQVDAATTETMLAVRAKEGVRVLVAQLFALPAKGAGVNDGGHGDVDELLVSLPVQTQRHPRALPAPAPKAETRWEKYAKEHGITSKKRGRMEWDDQAMEYKPRFGYGSASNQVDEQWAFEVKGGDDPFDDPWAQRRADKKERINKNERNAQRNVERAQGQRRGKHGVSTGTSVVTSAAGLPVDMRQSRHETGFEAAGAKAAGGGKKRGREGTAAALAAAQLSTASNGLFDRKVVGEGKKKKGGERRKFGSASEKGAAGKERVRGDRIIEQVLAKSKRKADTGDSQKFKVSPYDGVYNGEDGGFRKKKGRAAAGTKGGKNKRPKTS